MKRSSGVPKVERIKEEPEESEEQQTHVVDKETNEDNEDLKTEKLEEEEGSKEPLVDDLGDVSQGLTITEITGDSYNIPSTFQNYYFIQFTYQKKLRSLVMLCQVMSSCLCKV